MTTLSPAAFPPIASALALGQTHTTLYVADPQFEHLGPRSAVDNPLIDRMVPSADRNLISTSTAPLFVDTLLNHVRENHDARSMQVLGDVPDTPCKSELTHFEKVLDRHPVPVEGYDRGNHSSSNAYGVVNLLSRAYRFLVRVMKGRDPLKKDVCQSCSNEGNVLTPRETFRGMHRILHRHHANAAPIERINRSVAAVTGKAAIFSDGTPPVLLKPSNHRQIVEAFWKPTPDSDGRARYWESMVNFEVADQDIPDRKTKVTPFYVQATEEARFRLESGTEVPVYTISMDSLDNGNPLAVIPGVSALQVRLVEAFIEEKLKENPNARFKLSSHFSSIRILKGATSCEARELLRGLLSREEVVLFSGGHSHERELTNLTEKLGLKRASGLMEIIVPSLVDYHPSQNGDSKMFQDARALVIETMKVEKDAQGRPVLRIDLEYQGLDREDLKEGHTSEVEERLKWFKGRHGYQRAKETVNDLKRRHIRGFAVRRLKHLGECLGLFGLRALRKGWKRVFSPVQALFDNFTVVSTVQMFNECEHYIPFLESLVHFMKMDEEGVGESAARAQIEGILTLLQKEYAPRRQQFEKEVQAGTSAVELKRFNDLYEIAGMHLLPELFLQLKMGGQARAFAVLAGLDASQEEYEYHRGRPTKVPNNVPAISIPIG
ncbi:MAG TPA: hypothetical protein VLJ37_00105 [bacterium]|nr:hypothetical protein [bacterium]